MIKFKKISTKLTLIFTSFFIVGMAVVCATLSSTSIRYMEEQLRQELDSRLSLFTTMLSSDTGKIERDLKGILYGTAVKQYYQSEKEPLIREALSEVQKSGYKYSFFNAEGDIIVASLESSNLLDNWEKSDPFLKSLSEPNKLFIHEDVNNRSLSVLATMFNKNFFDQQVGGLTLSVEFSEYFKSSISHLHEQNHQLLVKTTAGEVWLSRIGTTRLFKTTKIIGEGPGFVTIDHRKFFFKKDSTSGMPFEFYVLKNEVFLKSRVQEMLILFFIIMFGITFFGACIIFWVSSHVAAPVKNLEMVVNLLASGKLEARAAITGEDEISVLAKAFNKMADELERSTAVVVSSKQHVYDIIQSISEMLFVTDSRGGIQRINKKVLDLLGYDERELLNKNIDKIFDTETPSKDFMQLNKLIQQNMAEDLSWVCVTKSGEKIPVLISANILKDSFNVRQNIVFSMKDVRESRLLDELRLTQLQLIQAAKLASLGEMSAGLAHELNNPLSFVKGFNNRIKIALKTYGQVSEDEIGELVQEIDYGADRMIKIIEGFRDFSRISDNKMEPLQLNKVVERSFALFAEQLTLKNIHFKFNLCEDYTLINGDANRLEQVFFNLIANARDALASCGENHYKEISVNSKSVDGFIVVDFCDTGGGIPADKVSSIFDPFFTTKAVGQGTGLGLSISHGIINDHGGELSVTSQLNVGTTFSIKIPLIVENINSILDEQEKRKHKKFQAQKKQDLENSAKLAESEKYLARRVRVLIVDDEPVVLKLFCMLLEDDYDVLTAESVDAAEEILLKNEIDVVASDYQMPNKTGVDLAKFIISKKLAIPIVIVTGHGAEAINKEAMASGVVCVVAKPCSNEELRSAINMALGRSRAA